MCIRDSYLIDEAVSNGKGANATISYVHSYLENHGMGETKAYFHADNCTGKIEVYRMFHLFKKNRCDIFK